MQKYITYIVNNTYVKFLAFHNVELNMKKQYNPYGGQHLYRSYEIDNILKIMEIASFVLDYV